MSFLARLMSGLEWRTPERSYALDFVVSNEAKTIMFLAGWWPHSAFPGEGMFRIASPLSIDSESIDVVARFEYDDSIVIGEPSDQEIIKTIQRERLRGDIDRGTYIQMLQRMRKEFPEHNFAPWIRAILARPQVRASDVLSKKLTRLRKIGGIFLFDNHNKQVDVLVVDQDGNAASLDPDGWLNMFAEEWRTALDRSSVEEYLESLSQETPYGGYVLGAPVFNQREGHVEDVALELMGK